MPNIPSVGAFLRGNRYPGRGIAVGKSPSGRFAAVAYFIMGRSENSRNRVFVKTADGIRTQAFDPEKMRDASLIIYSPVRRAGNDLIVANGDQSDTIASALKIGGSFEDALRARTFEPDAPHFTPRISALLTTENGDFSYQMSILKSADEAGSACARYFFDVPALAGEGRLIHTYEHDGDVLPSFSGEPRRVAIPEDIDEWTVEIWSSLDPDNRISLFTRYLDLKTGEETDRIVNKNEEDA